jgi:hypothetical protein
MTDVLKKLFSTNIPPAKMAAPAKIKGSGIIKPP